MTQEELENKIDELERIIIELRQSNLYLNALLERVIESSPQLTSSSLLNINFRNARIESTDQSWQTIEGIYPNYRFTRNPNGSRNFQKT